MSDVKEQEKPGETPAAEPAAPEPPASEAAAPEPPASEGAAPSPPAEPAAEERGASLEPEPAAEPPKKKKKKKKKVEVGAAGDTAAVVAERPALDADGRERPRFLLRFPRDPDLEPLIEAFEAGNFRKVREDAPRLAERTERPEVKRAAEELLRRIEPDPLVKFILGVAVFLFVAVVTYVYYAHG
jgi:hypothetical protein